MKVCCAAIAFLSLLASAYAEPNLKELQAKVRAEYVRHEMVLRKSGFEHELRFDDGGNPVAPLTPAPLVSGAALLITDAQLKSTEVRFDAVRLLLVGKKLEPVATEEKATIRIEFRVPISSVEQVQAAMPHVFFTPAEFQQAIGSYYVPLLDVDAAKTGDVVAKLQSAPVYKAGKGQVEIPRPLKTPDPDYTREARKARDQGLTDLEVVIDSSGVPAYFEVTKSLPHGLSEKALEAVAAWRFAPATKDGVPVPVLLHIQVNFRLF